MLCFLSGTLEGALLFHMFRVMGDSGNDAADKAAREGVDNGATVPEDAWKEMMDMLEQQSSRDNK